MIKDKIAGINARLFPGHVYQDPKWIVLGVNNVCNLHCKMCDVGTQSLDSNFAVNLVGAKPIQMPIELFKKIADQTSKYFPSARMGYAYTEPLVYKHLGESLEYVTHKNLDAAITTNAFNLTRHAEVIAKNNVSDLFISLDGPQEMHNEIRGNKRSFQNAIAGIEKVLSYDKGPDISIYSVITEWNIGHLKEFVTYFKDYNIKEIGFMHPNYTTHDIADRHNLLFGKEYFATSSSLDDMNLDNINLTALHEEISDIRSEKYPFKVNWIPDMNSPEELDLFYNYPEKKISKKCMDIYQAMFIKSNGSVIPAHGRCYNLEVGNIYKSEMKLIWNSSIFSEFRKTVNKSGGFLPACTRCCGAL